MSVAEALRAQTISLRERLDQLIAAGELDGFIAAAYLARYHGEDLAPTMIPHALALNVDAFVVTRTDTARLGIALERGWIPDTPAARAAFTRAYEQLRRQRPEQALDYRTAPRILWGIARGAIAVAGSSPDVRDALITDVRTLRERERALPHRFLALSALLADLDPAGAIGDEVSQYLLGHGDAQDPRDVFAMLWALVAHPFTASTDRYAAERAAFRSRLLPIGLRIEPRLDDVFDLLGAYAYGEALATGLDEAVSVSRADKLTYVLEVFDLFAELATSLRDRRKGHPPLHVSDEYDVQDVLYVALKPILPDLFKEEPTTIDAGSSKRIDIVSQRWKICIESKMTHEGARTSEFGDQLRVDIESYYLHPACDTLAIFVWDPALRIRDRAAFEQSLSGDRTIKGRRVRVVVRVRPS